MREKGDFVPHRVITSCERKRFPGEEWVYLKLYAAVGQHEELLAGPVRELIHVLPGTRTAGSLVLYPLR